MTVLTVVQSAASQLGLAIPDALYGETARTSVELREQLEETAQDILEAYDWNLLRTRKTHAGDGSTTAFDLPDDYKRFIDDARIWSSELQTPLRHVLSTDEWEELVVRQWDFVIGVFQILGGQLQIMPAPSSGATISYYYISDLIVTPEGGGTNANVFAADGDTFRLSERLLKLGLVWRWKKFKRLSFEAELEDYELEKARLIKQDGGAKMLTIGQMRAPKGVKISYPRPITA